MQSAAAVAATTTAAVAVAVAANNSTVLTAQRLCHININVQNRFIPIGIRIDKILIKSDQILPPSIDEQQQQQQKN